MRACNALFCSTATRTTCQHVDNFLHSRGDLFNLMDSMLNLKAAFNEQTTVLTIISLPSLLLLMFWIFGILVECIMCSCFYCSAAPTLPSDQNTCESQIDGKFLTNRNSHGSIGGTRIDLLLMINHVASDRPGDVAFAAPITITIHYDYHLSTINNQPKYRFLDLGRCLGNSLLP